MYKDFFGITEPPFSIVPSARFLYLSERHREALTHMLASLSGGGGFGLLTGEVGTGKTTVLRALIARLPQETQVAVILNPSLSTHELLASICDEFAIEYPQDASLKVLTNAIYQHLLANHSQGKQTLLLIDEAQHLMPDVMEQLRLLTNLETESVKLLKVVLVGQPELQQLLQQERLRQLAQRITSRYHLLPLTVDEVNEYINYRLRAVDCLHSVFAPAQTQQIAKATGGIPRLINLVCDKSMQLGYQHSVHQLNKELVAQACQEVMNWQLPTGQPNATTTRAEKKLGPLSALAAGVLVAAGAGYWLGLLPSVQPVSPTEQPVSLVTASKVINSVSHNAETVKPAMTAERADPQQAEHNWQERMQLASSERRAMQALYQLWGYETQLNQANCESGVLIQLSCFDGKGSLEQLGLINRPAVITLKEPQGNDYYAVVYAIGSKEVQLLVAGERIAVSRQWLQKRWSGGYSLLWRPPLGDKSAIRYGQYGPRVRWLDNQLSALLGLPAGADDTFEQELLDKLRRFQRAQDLTIDGIAGPRTLMVIDSALNLPGPTLQPEKS
ncbi:AAA family ATPase [Photobacterium minamisatsumaniensis]|uniref:ExeA family protein n=1 Tax=Photobacterium minamisatsumaniensis TaxID=2910233 RepID=UPI003D104D9E